MKVPRGEDDDDRDGAPCRCAGGTKHSSAVAMTCCRDCDRAFRMFHEFVTGYRALGPAEPLNRRRRGGRGEQPHVRLFSASSATSAVKLGSGRLERVSPSRASLREWLDLVERRRLAKLDDLLRRRRREQVHYPRDDSSPPGLVTRTDPRAVIAMEELVEQHVVPPVRVVLKLRGRSVHRPPPILAAQEHIR